MTPLTPIRLAFREMAGYVRQYRICGFTRSEKAGLAILRDYRRQWREEMRLRNKQQLN